MPEAERTRAATYIGMKVRRKGDGQAVAVEKERMLAILDNGQIVNETVRLLPWGSNYTFQLTVHDAEFETEVIYKPQRGERPLWDFPDGTLCLREVAAYLVSEALGWELVPPTLLGSGPQGLGMLQYFVEADPNANYFTLHEKFRPQLERIALFDHVINNADRKGGHCLLDNDGRLWAIDHGICFSAHSKLRTVIWDFAGQPIPPNLLEGLRAFCDRLVGNDSLVDELRPLLTEREIGAMRGRVDDLLETGRYPTPGPGRNYPWPPL